jgi:hypothetical protein
MDSHTREESRRIISDLTVGKSVTAYVNPSDPQQAVLAAGGSQIGPGWMGGAIVLIIIGVVAGLIAIYIFIRSF